MNKLITKIVGAALGLTMAVGVGVGFGVGTSKEAVPVHAAGGTETITLQESTFSGMGNNNYGSGTEYTGTVTSTSTSTSVSVGGHYITKNSGWQWQANNANVYNKTALPGRITQIVLTQTGTARAFTAFGGTEQLFSSTETGTSKSPSGTSLGNVSAAATMTWTAGSDTNYTYFAIHKGANAGKVTSVVVTFEAASVETYTVSFNANGGTGTMSDVSDVTGSYSLPANGFTAPSGKAFVGWKANNAGNVIAVGGSYTVSADVTFYAQWADQRTLTYNANGGTGTMTDTNSPYGDGATVTVLANAFTAPDGKRFSHWNTASDDSGTSYDAGDTFSIDANTILYAIWEDKPSEVVINHGDVTNGGTNYATRNWTSGDISGTTLSAINSSGYFQFQKTSGANACFIANSDAIPGPITKIEITKKGTSATTAFDAYFGTSQITSKPESGAVSQSASNNVWTWNVDADEEFTYFYVVNGADDTKYFDDITITYKKVSLVDPTEITLDNSSAITMDTYGYGNRKLVATVEPYNANDKTVTWGTNNPAVVTIDDGVLTPVGVGSTTVFAHTANYDAENPDANLIKTVSVTVNQAEYKKATFTPTSGSAATQSDDYLAGGSVAVSGNYNGTAHAFQLTTNNSSASFTISGYDGMNITGIDLVMSSNAAAGTGSLTVSIGSTDVLEIETAPFSDASWNGAYDANPVNLYKDSTDYVVGTGEDIVFSFGATANSLYVYSVSVRYLDYSLEAWCQNFLDNLTCDDTGATAPSVNDWDDLGLAFLALDSELQTIAKNATANESGTIIERAMAKYDYIVAKYGSSTYDNFINRAISPLQSAKILQNIVDGNTGTTVSIIVIISMVSLTAIGGYFFIRKRKEQ